MNIQKLIEENSNIKFLIADPQPIFSMYNHIPRIVSNPCCEFLYDEEIKFNVISIKRKADHKKNFINKYQQKIFTISCNLANSDEKVVKILKIELKDYQEFLLRYKSSFKVNGEIYFKSKKYANKALEWINSILLMNSLNNEDLIIPRLNTNIYGNVGIRTCSLSLQLNYK